MKSTVVRIAPLAFVVAIAGCDSTHSVGSLHPAFPTSVPSAPTPVVRGLNGGYRGSVTFAEKSECGAPPINMVLALRQDGETVTGSWLIPGTSTGIANGGPLSGRIVTVPSLGAFGHFTCELTNVDSDYYAFDTTVTVEDGGAFAGTVAAGMDADHAPCVGTVNFDRSR